MAKKRREKGLFGQPVHEASEQPIVRIVKLALRLARGHLTEYSHKKRPQKFTQPRLFACLILKAHMGLTYRKAEELLILTPTVRETIGLSSVPQFTTMQMFADRPEITVLIDGVRRTIGRAVKKANPQDAALDGTGMGTTTASAHCISRVGRKRTRFVKLLIGVLCASVLPATLVVGWGPSHDMKQAWALREKLKATTKPGWLWGDKAFDCEECTGPTGKTGVYRVTRRLW